MHYCFVAEPRVSRSHCAKFDRVSQDVDNMIKEAIIGMLEDFIVDAYVVSPLTRKCGTI